MNIKKKSKKHCVLIIDGVDGVGKTTVCRRLSEKLGFPVIKMPGMKEYFDNSAEKMSKYFNSIVEQFNPGQFILDRGYPSSLVYSKIFERQDNLGYIPSHCKTLSAKVFILTAESATLSLRKAKDEIPSITQEKRIVLDQEYKFLANFMRWEIIDTTELTTEETCQKIIEKI